ncbi:hypothetical protein EJB05_20907, partial [Eragrostis curvula]
MRPLRSLSLAIATPLPIQSAPTAAIAAVLDADGERWLRRSWEGSGTHERNGDSDQDQCAAPAAAKKRRSEPCETNPAMGASNSHHVLGELKITDGGKNVRVKYASSSMQGWCAKMEDACAVVPDLDGVTSFFGVYDGHGGAEVALYCATEFHFKLCSNPNYQKDLNNEIRSVFSRIDWLLKQSNDWMESINPTVEEVDENLTSWYCPYY